MLRSLSGPLLLLSLVPAVGHAEAGKAFKLFVRDSGVYGVTFEQLAAAGLAATDVPSEALGLRRGDDWMPLWVEDGGDGRFGPGDRVEFVAEQLHGEHSYFSDFTPFNVYWLETGTSGAPRIRAVESPAGDCPAVEPRTKRHFEQDVLRVRFRADRGEREPEVWYWQKVTYLGNQTFDMDLELSDLDATASEPVHLRLGLKGWSEMNRDDDDLEDHTVEVRWDGHAVAQASWDNQPYGLELEVAELPADSVEPGPHRLSVSVPQRANEKGQPLVDLVLVNWVEVEYAVASDRTADQDELAWSSPQATQCVSLAKAAETELVVFDRQARRFEAGSGAPSLSLPGGTADAAAWVMVDDRYLTPARIDLDVPSDWARTDRQADYIIVTHPTLAAAIEPLADYHRQHGLSVVVASVTDVYDEFGGGIETPEAIRAFLRNAWEHWRKPSPRFVLLVGDASWDTKNALVEDENYADWGFRHGRVRNPGEFGKNESTPYEGDASLNVRNLVPTWAHPTFQGHAASDADFVTFDPDDPDLPVMAIGRFPVVDPAEVTAIVDKTIRYGESAPVGPWRARALFITNQEDIYQRMSDDLAWEVSEEGLGWEKIYPASKDTSNALHTAHLVEALDEGQLLVHFVGHGGRYIWRTGPPDFRKNHDLFTLDDLEKLTTTDRPAVVISMSCYSAPFDHPNADSIGEKFLRMPDRGAVGVIAASWRNTPNRSASRVLLEHLSEGGALGEALKLAKREVKDQNFRAQYNLLGDPALEIAVPSLALDLQVLDPEHVSVRIPASEFQGQAIVEWTDDRGEDLGRVVVPVDGPAFEASPEAPLTAEPALVRVYAWDAGRQIDGLGSHLFAVSEPPAEVTHATDTSNLGESRQ
ncbi:MAG: C25 family cysteine peptidase [Thermoanaerobaculia bacterium]